MQKELEASIRQLLLSNQDIIDITGGRVYYEEAPAGDQLPYVILQISIPPQELNRTKMREERHRYALAGVSLLRTEAQALAEAVYATMSKAAIWGTDWCANRIDAENGINDTVQLTSGDRAYRYGWVFVFDISF